MSEAKQWLVYEIKDRVYWKPNERGYTPDIESAGRYTLEKAKEICQWTNDLTGRKPDVLMMLDPALLVENAALTQKVAALQAFKDYVHKRLDDAGIPVDPPSVHRDAGCRIGGRLDIALAPTR